MSRVEKEPTGGAPQLGAAIYERRTYHENFLPKFGKDNKRPDAYFVNPSRNPRAPWEKPQMVFDTPDEKRTAFESPASEEEAEESRPRRRSRSQYDAMETHGSYGLIDTHQTTGGYRGLVAHIPRSSRAYTFDMRVGDTIHCNSVVQGIAVGGRLTVGFVTPRKYYRPGARVTECVIGVPEHEWAIFERSGGTPQL